jgi:Zn ribbon nucleic-acid-binding protein
MTEPTVWLTDDECPVCATALVLIGHGQPVQLVECRSCGWSERWDLRDGESGVVLGA